MARKGGLGKGLDSLIPNSHGKATSHTTKSTEESTNVDNIVDKSENKEKQQEQMVKVSLIEPNREQPRKKFEDEALNELADSIRQFGVLQPLLVKKKGARYEIIAGERRWRAAKLAGVKEVPVIIRDYTDQEIMEIALIENIQREDLNPIEEAQAYMRLIQEFHLKQEELGQRVAKSRTVIANRMRLLKLAPEVQDMLAEGLLSEGHARALLGLENLDMQVKAANDVVGMSLNVRETEKLVKRMQNPPQNKEKEGDPARDDKFFYDEVEELLRNCLNTKVVIRPKGSLKTGGLKGQIQIEYYSIEELDRITDLICDRFERKREQEQRKENFYEQ